MEYLPQVGLANVATKRDLDHLEVKIEALAHRFEARLQSELRRQTMLLMPAMAGMLAVFASVSRLL